MGLVANVVTKESTKNLTGHMGVGHNRYSTAGKSEMVNCQPFVVDTIHGKIAVAHNGELMNAKSLRKRILKHGIGLSSETDSELITQLMVSEPPCGEPDGPRWGERIKHLMSLAKCSYAIVVLTKDGLFGFRDPYGNRPLCIGKLEVSTCSDMENGKRRIHEKSVYILSSESCAFHSIGATYVREVEPGEIVHLTENGVSSFDIVSRQQKNSTPSFCIFFFFFLLNKTTLLALKRC